jgi:hypothetical protein
MMRFRSLAAAVTVGMLAMSPLAGCKQATSLLQNIGGMEGLTKFNDAFGANLLANPAVSKFLDAAAVDMVKRGVTTEVAKISDMPMPTDGVDLRTVLKEKNMDKEGKQGFKDCAEKATKDVAFSPAAAKGMMSLIGGVL